MRCRRCGQEVEEGIERCPTCALILLSRTDELPPVPVLEEIKNLDPGISNSRTTSSNPKIGAVKTTGKLKAGSQRNTLSIPRTGPLKRERTFLSLLKIEVSPKALLFCFISIMFLLTLGAGALFIFNYLRLSTNVPETVINQYPH